MSHSTKYFLLIVAGASLSGCLAMQQDLVVLQDDIRALQKSINSLQANQADLTVKMDQLNDNLTSLDAQLEENQAGTTQVTERLDTIEYNFARDMQALSGKLENVQTLPKDRPPNEIYTNAYQDFTQGQYSLALAGFQSYLEGNPKGAHASKAQYYIGESYYRQEQWEKASEEYGKAISRYSKSGIVAGAKYKKALSLMQLKKTDDAKTLLLSVVKEHPKSDEAGAARRALEDMGVKVPQATQKPASKPKQKKPQPAEK